MGFRFLSLSNIILIIALVGACGKQNESGVDGRTGLKEALPYTTVEWTDLMPSSDLEALLNPPDYIMEIEEDSTGDSIVSTMKSQPSDSTLDRYQQALISTEVRPEFNKKNIRIPGYIVPLEYDKNQLVTDFFLVPYFGACIHVPPPPPNQIVLVHSQSGMKFDDMNTPYWLSGELRTTLEENDLATSAYSMELQRYEVYSEP